MPGVRLTVHDRRVIERGVRAGWSATRISHAIGKHRTTVAREVARGSGTKARRSTSGSALRKAATGPAPVYIASVAQLRSRRRARRPKPCKLTGEFAVVVGGLLQANWSPQQIAVMLPRLFPERQDWRVSHETIYQSLFVQTRGELRKQLTVHLRTQRTTRRQRGGPPRGPIRGAISISERPAEVEDRAVPGHWESQWFCQAAIGSGCSGSMYGVWSRSMAQMTLMRRRASARSACLCVLPSARLRS